MAKSFTISMLIQMVNKVAGPAAAVIGSLNKIDQKALAASQRLAKMGDGLIEKGNRLKGGLIGTAALIAPVAGALKFASSWEDSLAKISTMTKMTTAQVRATWEKDFFKIARETGADLSDIGEAAYQALSAAVPEKELTGFLRTAVLASKVGFTSTLNAVDGMTSAMNAFGISAEQAGNLMMAAQIKGKTTINDISQNIGQLGPIAANMGMSFNEVMAALAGMTQTGSKTEQAMTGIRSIMVALAKQTDQQKQALKDIGIEFTADTIRQYGFIKSMQILDTAVRKHTKTEGERAAVLNDVFGRVEGLNAAFALLSGKGLQVYNETMKMGVEDTKLMERAQEQMGNKVSTNVKKMKNEFKIFMIEMGGPLSEVLKNAMSEMFSFMSSMRDTIEGSDALKNALTGLAGAIFGIFLVVKLAGVFMWGLGYATQFAAGAMWLFSSIFAVLKAAAASFGAFMSIMWGPVGLIAVGILAVILITILLIKHWDKVKKVAIKVASAIKSGFLDAMGAIGRAADYVLFPVFNLFKKIGVAIGEAAVAGANFAAGLAQSIGSGFMDLLRAIGDFFVNVGSTAWNAGKAAAQAFVNGFMSLPSKVLEKLGLGGTAALATGGLAIPNLAGINIPNATRPVGNAITVDMSGMTVNTQDAKDFARRAWGALKPSLEQQMTQVQRDKDRKGMK